MNTSRFGSKIDGNLKLELLYVFTAVMVALAVTVRIPRVGKTNDNRFPACYTNICFV